MKIRTLLWGALALGAVLSYQNCAPQMHTALVDDDNIGLEVTYPNLSLSSLSGDVTTSVAEGNSLTLRLELAQTQKVDLPIRIQLKGGTAQTETDISLPTSIATIPAGQTSIEFSVSALSDNLIEDIESFEVSVRYQDYDHTSNVVTVSIEDKTPLPQLMGANFQIQEGSSGDLVVTASKTINRDISFDVISSDGSAREGLDYERVSQRVTIPAGQNTTRVTIRTLSDSLVENNESLYLELKNAQFALLPSGPFVVTISDQTVLPVVTMASVTGKEGSVLSFTASLSSAATQSVTLNYETIDGSALAGIHYVGAVGSITIPIGAKAASIKVSGINQPNHDTDKKMTLRLTTSNATPQTLSATGTFTESLVCDGVQRITLSSIFQENMVLHDSSPRIWGMARPNTDVDVSLQNRSGSTVRARADASGKWQVTIPQTKLTPGDTAIVVKNVCETKVLPNVKLGEVWLCSGQSNMRWNFFQGTTSDDEFIADLRLSEVQRDLRFFMVQQDSATTPQSEFEAPDASYRKWQVPNASFSGMKYMSAVCYHFGRELHKKLNKPIGLIASSYGGTAIETWIPKSAGGVGEVYNAMISPLGSLKISGVAWYQGENNRHNAGDYTSLMNQMTTAWRAQFLNQVLDFHTVQLAGYGVLEDPQPGRTVSNSYHSLKTALVRHAQQLAADADPHISISTAIGASTSDATDIHPRNKKTVGERLSRSALTLTYGYPDTQPTWQHSSIREMTNSSIRIPLRFPEGVSLPTQGDSWPGFYIKEGSNRYMYASRNLIRTVDAATRTVWVEVYHSLVSAPDEVRFQFTNNPSVPYMTSPHNTPLLPLCAKKRGNKWEVCQDFPSP